MPVPEMLGAAMAMAQSISVNTSPVHATINCMLGADLPGLKEKHVCFLLVINYEDVECLRMNCLLLTTSPPILSTH